MSNDMWDQLAPPIVTSHHAGCTGLLRMPRHITHLLALVSNSILSRFVSFAVKKEENTVFGPVPNGGSKQFAAIHKLVARGQTSHIMHLGP